MSVLYHLLFLLLLLLLVVVVGYLYVVVVVHLLLHLVAFVQLVSDNVHDVKDLVDGLLLQV